MSKFFSSNLKNKNINDVLKTCPSKVLSTRGRDLPIEFINRVKFKIYF